MIARLRIGTQRKTPRFAGPGDRRALFDSGQPLRQLRVMIDAELCIEPEWSPAGLLAGLLLHEYIELYRFSNDGPPTSLPRVDTEMPGEFVKGWVILGQKHPEYVMQELFWADDSGESDGGISSDAGELAKEDTKNLSYSDLGLTEAAGRRHDDAVAAETADSIGADIFITRREYLHSCTWSLGSGVTFLTPEDALPFVSMYLRAQGEFLIWKGERGSAAFNRGLFYWVGTRDLLPSSWRWFAACVQHSRGINNDHMLYTGQAALQRIDRVLELRDALHLALNRPQDNDVADDALVAFDSALVFLMGAFDATARVAHYALSLGGKSHDAGWQRARWRGRVAKASSRIGAVVADGTPGSAVLNILAKLRNTVHSAGLTPVGITTAMNYRERTMINLSSGVSGEDMVAFLASIDVLGGRKIWGVESRPHGRYLADPGVLLDRLLPPAIELLNELMRLTPVERLESVTAGVIAAATPENAARTFGEKNRQSIRWQLGL